MSNWLLQFLPGNWHLSDDIVQSINRCLRSDHKMQLLLHIENMHNRARWIPLAVNYYRHAVFSRIFFSENYLMVFASDLWNNWRLQSTGLEHCLGLQLSMQLQFWVNCIERPSVSGRLLWGPRGSQQNTKSCGTNNGPLTHCCHDFYFYSDGV